MTMPDGYSNDSGSSPKKSDGKNLIGAVVIVAIVLVLSIVLANGIWDFAHDDGESKVALSNFDCKDQGYGRMYGSVDIRNNNDFAVIVEWKMNENVGYANVPAKSIISDGIYANSVPNCAAKLLDVTKVP